MDVNKAATIGIMEIGIGFSNLQDLTAILNIPPMSNTLFQKEQNIIADAWAKTAAREMELAIEEEKRLAKERGDVDADGDALITVVADGSWAKRSYRSNYSSLSGAAAIVGYETKKVLHLGVRNKYCSTCQMSQRKGIEVKRHECFKNWSGSSSSMEADIIVDGFLQSSSLHKVKYTRMIADGDSNVYMKVLASRPYDNTTVQKIECRNHLMRNLFNKLRDVVKDGKTGYNIKYRKTLGSSLPRLRASIDKATEHWNQQKVSNKAKISNLRQNIENAPYHIFGWHKNCQDYFCDNVGSEENSMVKNMKEDGLFYKIKEYMQTVEDHADSILYCLNNNAVEHFNSQISKKIGGKRVNFCLRRSYQARCHAAVVSYNNKSPVAAIHKVMLNRSPGHFTKLQERRRIRKLEKERANKRPRKKLFLPNKDKKSYGVLCQRPDISPDRQKAKTEKFLKELELSEDQRIELMRKTSSQSESILWFEERRKRLTASNFGTICKMLPTTSCANTVKGLLYSTFENSATKYGRLHESKAIGELEIKMNIKVKQCGLFIDEKYSFLGASPDGVIENTDGIIEIKCPITSKEMHPIEYLRKGRHLLIPHKQEESIIQINKKHNHFYQVQGQLHVTQKDFCLFAVWSPMGLIVERIERDDDFWKEKMESHLEKFYKNCILPELIDPRQPRSMPIRDPQYILDAQIEKEKHKTKKKSPPQE